MALSKNIKKRPGGFYNFILESLDFSAAQITPALREGLMNSNTAVVERVMVACSRFPDKETLAIVEAGTKSSDEDIRATAAISLSTYKDQNVTGILTSLLSDPSIDVRYHAVKATSMLNPPGMEESIAGLLQAETDPLIKGLASETLVNFPLVITELWGSRIQEGGNADVWGIFSHAGSTAPYKVIFNWGDGSEDTHVTLPQGQRSFEATHKYLDEGTGQFQVQVTVTTSDDSKQAVAITYVTVENVPPTISFNPYPGVINEGDILTLDMKIEDPGILDTHHVHLDWGDGSPVFYGKVDRSFSLSHTFVDNGQYAITATVFDNDGGTNMATASIEVRNVAPTVNALNLTPTLYEGGKARLLIVFSDPGLLDTHSADIDWGDGTRERIEHVTTPFEAHHCYLEDGDYPATITITDKDGGVGSTSLTIPVTNLAPIVVAGSDASIYSGQSYTLNGSFHDPGVFDTHTAVIDWGDGETSDGNVDESEGKGTVSGTHQYFKPGVYVIKLSVTDDEDATTTDSLKLTVKRQPIEINITPGESENRINPKSHGVIKVAILSNSAGEYGLPLSFDASRIDSKTLLLGTSNTLASGGGSAVKNASNSNAAKNKPPEFHFDMDGTGVDMFTTSLTVWGTTRDDIYFEGTDNVKVVPGGTKGKKGNA